VIGILDASMERSTSLPLNCKVFTHDPGHQLLLCLLQGSFVTREWLQKIMGGRMWYHSLLSGTAFRDRAEQTALIYLCLHTLISMRTKDKARFCKLNSPQFISSTSLL
jgi:hypothetical protein